MATIATVSLALEAQHAAFARGLGEATKAVNGLNAAAAKGAGDVSRFRAALDGLRESAGRGSTLDQLAKTLRGAGAVAGISLIGTALANATSKAAELSEEFRKGQIGAAGVGVKLAESLPVIGGFVSAGQSIRELFTHEKEQIEDINRTARITNEIAEERVRLAKQVTEATRDLDREAAAARVRAAASDLGGEAGKRLEVQYEYKVKGEDLAIKVQRDLDAVAASTKTLFDKNATELGEMKIRLAAATPGTDQYKTLDTQLHQITATMAGLEGQAKAAKAAIQASAADAGAGLASDSHRAEVAGLNEYLEKLNATVRDADPDPIHKIRTEVAALHGDANAATQAIILFNRGLAAEQAKRGADALREWTREADEAAARVKALQGGADEQTAERLGKLGQLTDAQQAAAGGLADRQRASDAALKSLEGQRDAVKDIAKLTAEVNTAGLDAAERLAAERRAAGATDAQARELAALTQQKAVVEDIARLKLQAAQSGLTEAQKELDNLKRAGADTYQLGFAKMYADQIAAAERMKKEQEDAKRLIEESAAPIERLQVEFDKVLRLQRDGLLTAHQADEALKRAASTFDRADGGEGEKHARAEVRRFDFRGPSETAKAKPAEAALTVARQQLDSLRKSEDYQQQIWQQGLQQQQNPTQTADF